MSDLATGGAWALSNLGTCCMCGKDDPATVRNLICLDYRAPVPGSGWGCFVCGLPMDGAMTVICDECLKTESLDIKFAIEGSPIEKRRVPLASLEAMTFQHDVAKHAEDAAYDDWYEGQGALDDDEDWW